MRSRALVLGVLLNAVLLVLSAPAFGASKNVELLDTLPEAKNATAINLLSYSGRSDVMLVTGRFGLKTYSLKDPANPALLDEITAEDLRLAERGHRRRPDAQARAPVTRPARVRRLDLA